MIEAIERYQRATQTISTYDMLLLRTWHYNNTPGVLPSHHFTGRSNLTVSEH